MPQRMKTVWVLLLLLATTAVAQSFEYAPGPQPGFETGGPSPYSSPPAPPSSTSDLAPVSAPISTPVSTPISTPISAPISTPLSAPLSAPVPAPALNGFSPEKAPSPSPGVPSPGPPAVENTAADVKWCAVRNEFEACLTYTSQLSTRHLSWTCVLRDSTGECMDAIQNGQANLISLEAGLAYIAFLNHSMKAIMAEEYTFHAQSYAAVAVVNQKMCDSNSKLKLEDFKNMKSCHPGYLTAAGWNYPVQALVNSVQLDSQVLEDGSLPNDVKVISSFFSESCAPSELGEGGICTGCGKGDNSTSCPSAYNQYAGEDGAFRCLMDGTGDIAFLRAETPTLYSSDGRNNQSWSTKSVDEFMYLCPSGGCKAVNTNYGSCQFATVPANVIMTPNSLPEPTKQAIITTLLAANWTQSLYTGNNWENYLLSVSTQGLVQVNQLTRQYLGTSAVVSQTILDIDSNGIQPTAVTNYAVQSTVSAYSLSFALGALTMGVLGAFFDFL